MEKTTETEERRRHYLTASGVVDMWMNDYKRYLLDGDPNIVHPKAKAALVLGITQAIDNAVTLAKPRVKRADAKT